MTDRRITAHARAAFALLALGGALPVTAQVSFPVSFDASTDALTAQERTDLIQHFEAAGQMWAAQLAIAGSRSIEISIAIDNTRPRSTGISATSAFVAQVNGRDTFEQGAAHELRTGDDPNQGAPDILITINTTYLRDELWLDPQPMQRFFPVPVDRTDAMSMALHEVGHALVYNGWADLATGQPPATFWSTWDRWMIPGTPTLFDGPASLASWGVRPDLTTGNIHHWHNMPVTAAGAPLPGKRANAPVMATRWYQGAPVPVAGCEGPLSVAAPHPADVGHPNTAGSKGGVPSLLDELMNGVLFYRGTRYTISPLDRAALADAGLPLSVIDDVFANGFE